MKIKQLFKKKAFLIFLTLLFLVFSFDIKLLRSDEIYPDYLGEFYFNYAEKVFNDGRYSEARSCYLTVMLNYKDKPFAKIAKEKSEKCWNIIKESRELDIIEENKKEGVIEITYEIVNKSKKKLLISYYIERGVSVNNFLSSKTEQAEYDVYLKPGQKIRENYLILRRFFWDERYKIDIKETLFLDNNEDTDVNAKPIKWGSIYQGELKLLEALRERELKKSLAEWKEKNKSNQIAINVIKGILLIAGTVGLIFLILKILKNKRLDDNIRTTEIVPGKDIYGGEMEFRSLKEREIENALKKGEASAIVKYFQSEFPLTEIIYWENRNILTLKMEIEPTHYISKEKISVREIGLDYRNQTLSEAMTIVYKIFDAKIIENFIDIVRVEFISNFIDKYGHPLKGCILSLEAPRKEVQKIVRKNFDVNNAFEIFSVYYQTDDNYKPRKVISHKEIDEQKYGIGENKIEQFEESLGLNIENLFEQEYENLIKVFLENLGLAIWDCKKIEQRGIYITAYYYQPILKGKYIIFARNHTYSSFVEVREVRELFGILIHESAQKGILIALSDFTNESIEFSKEKPLELINRKNLELLLQKHIDQSYLKKMNLMVVK
ncbi:MAG: hypothetical protein A2043_00760 [Candidatus Schekmanbacteria bacterium GWA2_38_9]|nr:MAG: hypothetical protein A2043_00760 [Candidatus Schekmanbacteria bacterium GWA2_38_9]OGL49085.1 MAG: hypothetical protein A3H37_03885 [Candidatus Schekmanbacteria bacterium RIFCSPLOWO2_02_FULL_38_14]